MCWKLIAILNLLQIRMREDIFGIEKCKVTFGLKYMLEDFCLVQVKIHEVDTTQSISDDRQK